ncbi:MAG: uroporphyrinogen-III C-methyltransferase [Puniceicoccaceae bacterium]|nr:MAG: uroporphyrinogen-III C-methyltransferase [Puniceicoccaceae bacterium]
MSVPSGWVALVGAGPGDPELVTLRARELIGRADVLVYDNLVDRSLLAWTRPDCERIFVGKSSGRHTLPQQEIEAILVDRAGRGLGVVRLKGGDPFVFGRGGEELEQVLAAGLACEVVPGVSAALAAGACTGIPLTLREESAALVFVTGHEDPAKHQSQVNWRALPKDHATLCIYMGMGRLESIVAEMIESGFAPETPAACVERASLPQQRTCRAPLAELPARVAAAGLKPPAVILVGDTVNRGGGRGREGRPLHGRRVVVTRTREQSGELSARLAELGAEVLELPLIAIEGAVDPTIAGEIWEDLGSYDWLVFTSANGVRFFFEAYFSQYQDLRSLGMMRIAAVGSGTAKELEALHLQVELMPKKAVAEALADALIATGSLDSAKVLLITGNLNRPVLADRLETEGRAIVDRFPVYRTRPADLAEHPAARDFRRRGAHAILFASSSAVRAFAAAAGQLTLDPDAQRPKAFSIGPVTTKAMQEAGIPLDGEAVRASPEALVDLVRQTLSHDESSLS